MADVNRKYSLSGDNNIYGVGHKTEVWYVKTTLDEPEDVIRVDGLPVMKAFLSGTNMRVMDLSASLVNKASDGEYVWDVTVKYETLTNTSEQEEHVDGDEIWTIGGQMGNQIVKKALEQTGMGTSPDMGLSVGVKDDGTIEGAPWGKPNIKFSITLYKNVDDIDDDYISDCLAEVGHVLKTSAKNANWYGFSTGELRLESVSIPKKMEELWTIQFDFGYQPNEVQDSLPKYKKIDETELQYSRDVLGWEYTWLKEAPGIDTVYDTKKLAVEGLYIAKFFTSSTFENLGLSGSLF